MASPREFNPAPKTDVQEVKNMPPNPQKQNSYDLQTISRISSRNFVLLNSLYPAIDIGILVTKKTQKQENPTYYGIVTKSWRIPTKTN